MAGSRRQRAFWYRQSFLRAVDTRPAHMMVPRRKRSNAAASVTHIICHLRAWSAIFGLCAENRAQASHLHLHLQVVRLAHALCR